MPVEIAKRSDVEVSKMQGATERNRQSAERLAFDAKEFSIQSLADGLSVPCKPPPCRGCRPCVSCNPCRKAVNTDAPTAKTPIK